MVDRARIGVVTSAWTRVLAFAGLAGLAQFRLDPPVAARRRAIGILGRPAAARATAVSLTAMHRDKLAARAASGRVTHEHRFDAGIAGRAALACRTALRWIAALTGADDRIAAVTAVGIRLR